MSGSFAPISGAVFNSLTAAAQSIVPSYGGKMLVFLAVIVVNVCARDEFAQRLETFRNAIFFGAVGQMRVSDVEINPQPAQDAFLR